MLIPILGIPTGRTLRLVQSTARALTSAGVTTDTLISYSLQDLSAHLLRRRAPATLVLLPSPGPDWHRVLKSAPEPFLYLHTAPGPLASLPSPPGDASDGYTTRGYPLEYWSRALASFVELQGPTCTVIEADRADAGSRLALFVRERLSTAELDVDHDWSDPADPGLPNCDAQDPWEEAAQEVLRPLESLRRGKPPSRITVRPSLFYDATTGSPVEGPISVAEEPSTVFYGPYISIPSGVWRVTVRLDVLSELRGRKFLMDVASASGAAVTTTSNFSPQIGGLRDLSLEFRHIDWLSGVEVRLHVKDAGEAGSVQLLEADLTRFEG
jgi:hypothetical protein